MLYDTGTTMITDKTPYKLREIINDTWPMLYRPPFDWKPPAHYKITKKVDASSDVCYTMGNK